MGDKILVVDDDLDTLRLVGLMLERQGYSIMAASGGHQALSMAVSDSPSLILLDVMMPDIDGIEVTRQLRANPQTQSIPIIMFTAKSQLEDKVIGLDSGADAYLTKPTQPRELIAQVKAVLGRVKKTSSSAQPLREKGCIVGILSAKGGVGVSTIATNLAFAIQNQYKKEVILADFRPGTGTIGPELGYYDTQGMTRLLSVSPQAIDSQLIESELIAHESKIRVLLSSANPEDAKFSCAVESFTAIIQNLGYLGNYIIIDMGASLTPVNLNVLDNCQLVVLVVEPVPHTVIQSREIIDFLIRKGLAEENILPVLVNRVRSGMQLALSQVQDQLKKNISIIFTPAPEYTFQAITSHNPVVSGQPDSVTAQQFIHLAEKIVLKGGR